jgi:drug/metabolite transporter (DMT)-like permease
MGSELLSIIYGLISAASWGAGDFSGGLAAKRTPVYSVILISQLLGGLLLIALAFMFQEPIPAARYWLIGGLAGACGTLGLTALYQGLASGQMGVVTPIAAVVSAILPVLVGIYNEGLPAIQQLFGFALGILSVWYLSRESKQKNMKSGSMKLSLAAGIGFGMFLILIDQVSDQSLIWPLVSARISSVVLFLLIAILLGKKIYPNRSQLSIIALAGFFDTGGNAFFALASRYGRLDISAVISSLYPAATILLAWMILKEKLAASQWVGVCAALLAIALIAL